MVTTNYRYQFCAGHRVFQHESKCQHLHGHNYIVMIEATAKELDGLGRIIDFSILKEKIGGWIDKYWNHAFIVYANDFAAMKAVGMINDVNDKLFILPTNPTAENMAEYLLRQICPDLMDGTGITISAVTLWETEDFSVSVRM